MTQTNDQIDQQQEQKQAEQQQRNSPVSADDLHAIEQAAHQSNDNQQVLQQGQQILQAVQTLQQSVNTIAQIVEKLAAQDQTSGVGSSSGATWG